MNLICKLLGHKWRDTSYYEFKRENDQDLRRRIDQYHCNRCNETRIIKVNPWEVEKTATEKMLEVGNALVEGWRQGLGLDADK